MGFFSHTLLKSIKFKEFFYQCDKEIPESFKIITANLLTLKGQSNKIFYPYFFH